MLASAQIDSAEATAATVLASPLASRHRQQQQRHATTPHAPIPTTNTNFTTNTDTLVNNNATTKGLKAFSLKVSEAVASRGITTYSEVADALVQDLLLRQASEDGGGNGKKKSGNTQQNNNRSTTTEEKNIRRRVYDALNVLHAIKAIEKEKKEIRWVGLPCFAERHNNDITQSASGSLASLASLASMPPPPPPSSSSSAALQSLASAAAIPKHHHHHHHQPQQPVPLSPSQKLEELKAERLALAERVEQKQKDLLDSCGQAYCISNIILRNRDAPISALEKLTEMGMDAPLCLELPFLLVRLPAEAEVEYRPSVDGTSALLHCDRWQPMVHDDEGLLRSLGLGSFCPELLNGVSHLKNADTEALLAVMAESSQKMMMMGEERLEERGGDGNGGGGGLIIKTQPPPTADNGDNNHHQYDDQHTPIGARADTPHHSSHQHLPLPPPPSSSAFSQHHLPHNSHLISPPVTALTAMELHTPRDDGALTSSTPRCGTGTADGMMSPSTAIMGSGSGSGSGNGGERYDLMMMMNPESPLVLPGGGDPLATPSALMHHHKY